MNTETKQRCKCYIAPGSVATGNAEEIVQCPLCAAAPDLLEACKLGLRMMNQWGPRDLMEWAQYKYISKTIEQAND